MMLDTIVATNGLFPGVYSPVGRKRNGLSDVDNGIRKKVIPGSLPSQL